MPLQATISDQIKDAMKAKDQNRLAALRAIKSELLLLETSGQVKSEDGEIKMLQKMVKQRKESALLYEEQNRMDLVEAEIFQADVISEFLPQQLSDSELTEKIKEVIEQVGATSIADMGKVMGAATKAVAGKAEGKAISDKVKQLLSN